MSDDEQLRHVKNSEYDVCSRCGERWPCQVDEQDSEVERLTQENADLRVALAQHREVIQKVYDYGSLSQAELDAKYPRPHVNGLRLLGAVLAGRDQPAAGAELLAAIDGLFETGRDEPLMIDPSTNRPTFWFCGNRPRRGHTPDCAWQALIRARAGRSVGEGPGREG